MEQRQLKYFVTIAEELHYNHAAEKLFVSQPALSQQIQLLENEIGVELFVKIKRKKLRKVELTKAGESFLIDAKKILQLSQKAIENARKIGLQQEIIRLGVYKMLLKERIVEVITLFSSNFPTVKLKIIELPTFVSVQDALIEETIDLGLTLMPLRYAELSAKTTQQGHLVVILSAKHPLANEEFVKLSALKNEKWIEINKSLHPVYDEIENACQQAGFSRIPNIVQEVSSLELLCSLVGLGIGIAFIPSLFNLNHIEGIVLKNITNDDNTPFDAIEINHSIAFKTTSSSSLIGALVGLL
ncbi:MAG: LysR family transcriptional regulator [Arcicella sp.]|nr:LysR family transcriptional regulator [Arcicella sp.]